MKPETYILKLLIERMTRNPTGYWTVDKETLLAIQSIPDSSKLFKMQESGNVYMIFNPDSYKFFKGQLMHKEEQEAREREFQIRSKFRNTLLNALESKCINKGLDKELVAFVRDEAEKGLRDRDYTMFKKFKLLAQVKVYLDAITELVTKESNE